MTEENQSEIHLCKICGQKMSQKECIAHKEETGHDNFKPSQNNIQQLKGGSGKFLGLGSLLLPLIGLQFKILSIFGSATPVIGVMLMVIGILMVIFGRE
jgi:hypothetical protein